MLDIPLLFLGIEFGIQVGFGTQVAKTSTCPFMYRFPLFVALSQPTERRTDGRTDGRASWS